MKADRHDAGPGQAKGLKGRLLGGPVREESHGLVQSRNIDSWYSNSQLGDRSVRCRHCNLAHLHSLNSPRCKTSPLPEHLLRAAEQEKLASASRDQNLKAIHHEDFQLTGRKSYGMRTRS